MCFYAILIVHFLTLCILRKKMYIVYPDTRYVLGFSRIRSLWIVYCGRCLCTQPETNINNCELHGRLADVWYFYYNNVGLYRVIHKSLLDFRLLRYSSRDGHAEGEHVNRGRDTPSFCPNLQVLDISTLGDAADGNPANSKTQNAFLFPVHAMFRHDCPLAVKPASTPRRLVHTHTHTHTKL